VPGSTALLQADAKAILSCPKGWEGPQKAGGKRGGGAGGGSLLPNSQSLCEQVMSSLRPSSSIQPTCVLVRFRPPLAPCCWMCRAYSRTTSCCWTPTSTSWCTTAPPLRSGAIRATRNSLSTRPSGGNSLGNDQDFQDVQHFSYEDHTVYAMTT